MAARRPQASRAKYCELRTRRKRRNRSKNRQRQQERQNNALAYRARDAILAAIGYPSYAEYLQSELWSRIRRRVLSRDGWKCRVCQEQANEIHHWDYSEKTLLGENIGGLVALCRLCHRQAEIDRDGFRRGLAKANEFLKNRADNEKGWKRRKPSQRDDRPLAARQPNTPESCRAAG